MKTVSFENGKKSLRETFLV